MKLIDEKGRLFGLVNVIDLFVAVLIVAIVAFGGYKLSGGQAAVVEQVTRPVMVTALISDVRQPTVDVIKVGELVRDPLTKGGIGTIVDLEVTPYKRSVETADGQIVLAEVPEKYDILVTLEARALVSELEIKLGSIQVHVGTQLPMQTKDYSVVATVFKVEEVE